VAHASGTTHRSYHRHRRAERCRLLGSLPPLPPPGSLHVGATVEHQAARVRTVGPQSCRAQALPTMALWRLTQALPVAGTARADRLGLELDSRQPTPLAQSCSGDH
jgi:hypothetical protein